MGHSVLGGFIPPHEYFIAWKKTSGPGPLCFPSHHSDSVSTQVSLLEPSEQKTLSEKQQTYLKFGEYRKETKVLKEVFSASQSHPVLYTGLMLMRMPRTGGWKGQGRGDSASQCKCCFKISRPWCLKARTGLFLMGSKATKQRPVLPFYGTGLSNTALGAELCDPNFLSEAEGREY